MSPWEFGTFILTLGLYLYLLNLGGKAAVGRATLVQPALIAGAVLAVVAALQPWATFVLNDGPYPAKATLQFFDAPFELEGFRLRLALFGIAGLVLNYLPIPGRHRAVRALGWGVGVISIVNLLMIAIKGGGVGAVTATGGTAAFGGFIGIAAGALLVVAGSAGGIEPIPQWRTDKLPRLGAYLVLLLAFAGLLWLVTDTLTSGGLGGPLSPYAGPEFLSYLGLLVGLLGALQAVGVLKWISTISEEHRPFSIAVLLLCAFGLPFTGAGTDYWMTVAVNVGVYAATAIGLNIVVGLAGLLDIGYVAFLGIGAFVAANLSGAAASKFHGLGEVPFILVLIICAVVAGIFGAIVGSPTLRVRGDYLAIVTLAFGEIFRKSAQENIGGFTGGANAIPNIPPISLGGHPFNEPITIGKVLPSGVLYYFFIVLLIALVMLIFANLKNSRIGRAWMAIREDEDAARAMGIKTGKAKILAFLVGATLAGLAGAVFAHKTSTVAYDSFQFLESVTLLAAVVLGGMGTIPGAVLGASLLFVLPEKLREFNDYRLLMFGLALVLIMRFRPQGLVPDRVRRAEFAGETESGLSLEEAQEQVVQELEMAEAEAAPAGAPEGRA